MRHEVVRLLPYHCELNTIKLACSQVKHYTKNNNKLFTLTAVKELTYGGIDQIGVMEWKKLIEHVQSKFEDKNLFEDGLYKEESVDECIISAGLKIQTLINFCTSLYIIYLYALFLSCIYIYNMFSFLSSLPCMYYNIYMERKKSNNNSCVRSSSLIDYITFQTSGIPAVRGMP